MAIIQFPLDGRRLLGYVLYCWFNMLQYCRDYVPFSKVREDIVSYFLVLGWLEFYRIQVKVKNVGLCLVSLVQHVNVLKRLCASQRGTERHCWLFSGGSNRTEFKPRWRLLGLCLAFQVYQSGPLVQPMIGFKVKGILVIVPGLSQRLRNRYNV